MSGSTAAVVALVLALCACGEGETPRDAAAGSSKAAPPADAASARPSNPHAGLPIDPSADPHAGVPGVRPVGSPQPALPSPVTWTAPSGWTETKSTRFFPMRIAEFEVAKDDAGSPVQCVVFGGIGGDDDPNIQRWIAQMGPAAKDGAKLVHANRDGLKITRLVARGPFSDSMGMGGAKSIPDAMVLAAIVEAPGGKIHVKLVGPAKVVEGATEKFEELIASMKAR